MLRLFATTIFASAAFGSAHAAAIDDIRPHRAVYDLSMVKASDRSGITGMSGRIVYELKGSVCDGFAVRFRFLTNVQTARKTFTNDQRTTTFEAGDGSSFNFVTQGYLNGQLEETTKGTAEKSDAGIAVSLTEPEEDKLDLERAIFQTEHVAKLVEAGRSGETIVEAKIYDGSDRGDQVMDTTAFIGRERLQRDAVNGESDDVVDALKDEPVWPVSVSYFTNERVDNSGERLPVYQVSFLMQGDGVSRDLKMQFDDYSLRGVLQDIEYLEQPACEASN
ncbi:MAG: DUF1849 family protein [Pseudomonadota bacterium]